MSEPTTPLKHPADKIIDGLLQADPDCPCKPTQVTRGDGVRYWRHTIRPQK